MDNIQKGNLNNLNKILKVFVEHNENNKFHIAISFSKIEIHLQNNDLDHTLLEPLTKCCVDNNINWSLESIKDGSWNFKLSIWK